MVKAIATMVRMDTVMVIITTKKLDITMMKTKLIQNLLLNNCLKFYSHLK